MSRFDASVADCHIFTFKDGLLSAVAHDLKLRVGRFEVLVQPDPISVSARFEVASLEVVCAVKEGHDDVNTLSSRDHDKIRQTMLEEVLESRRFPEVLFRSTRVESRGAGYEVQGQLKLKGVERAITGQVKPELEGWLVEVSLHQPDFGIKPYSAMLGTLKVKPELRVRLRTRAR